MKIVTQLYGAGGARDTPIGVAELSLEAYERWTGTGHARGRAKTERFHLYNMVGDAIMVRVVVVWISQRHWPGLGQVRKYRLVVEDTSDAILVRTSPDMVWRDSHAAR